MAKKEQTDTEQETPVQEPTEQTAETLASTVVINSDVSAGTDINPLGQNTEDTTAVVCDSVAVIISGSIAVVSAVPEHKLSDILAEYVKSGALQFKATGEPFFLVVTKEYLGENGVVAESVTAEIELETLVGITDSKFKTFNRNHNPLLKSQYQQETELARSISTLKKLGFAPDVIATMLASKTAAPAV